MLKSIFTIAAFALFSSGAWAIDITIEVKGPAAEPFEIKCERIVVDPAAGAVRLENCDALDTGEIVKATGARLIPGDSTTKKGGKK